MSNEQRLKELKIKLTDIFENTRSANGDLYFDYKEEILEIKKEVEILLSTEIKMEPTFVTIQKTDNNLRSIFISGLRDLRTALGID